MGRGLSERNSHDGKSSLRLYFHGVTAMPGSLPIQQGGLRGVTGRLNGGVHLRILLVDVVGGEVLLERLSLRHDELYKQSNEEKASMSAEKTVYSHLLETQYIHNMLEVPRNMPSANVPAALLSSMDSKRTLQRQKQNPRESSSHRILTTPSNTLRRLFLCEVGTALPGQKDLTPTLKDRAIRPLSRWWKV